jgi:hypothetical protein
MVLSAFFGGVVGGVAGGVTVQNGQKARQIDEVPEAKVKK